MEISTYSTALIKSSNVTVPLERWDIARDCSMCCAWYSHDQYLYESPGTSMCRAILLRNSSERALGPYAGDLTSTGRAPRCCGSGWESRTASRCPATSLRGLSSSLEHPSSHPQSSRNTRSCTCMCHARYHGLQDTVGFATA